MESVDQTLSEGSDRIPNFNMWSEVSVGRHSPRKIETSHDVRNPLSLFLNRPNLAQALHYSLLQGQEWQSDQNLVARFLSHTQMY
jgi:hypothetical protein